MKKTILASIAAVVLAASASCGTAISAADQKETREKLLRQLGYEGEGPQKDSTLVLCNHIEDSLDETELKLDLKSAYFKMTGKTIDVVPGFNAKSILDPKGMILCIAYPTTQYEIRQHHRNILPAEQRERFDCETSYRSQRDACDSLSEGRTYILCDSQLKTGLSQIFWQFQEKKREQCMPYGKTMTEHADCIDRLAAVYGEHGSLTEKTNTEYKACVNPVKTGYEQCLTRAKTELENCKH